MMSVVQWTCEFDNQNERECEDNCVFKFSFINIKKSYSSITYTLLCILSVVGKWLLVKLILFSFVFGILDV